MGARHDGSSAVGSTAAAAGGAARVTLPSSAATMLTSPLQVHSDLRRGATDRRGGAVHLDDAA